MSHRQLVFLFLLLPLGFAFYSSDHSSSDMAQANSDTTMSPLEIYGEYIYNRESCRNCHSLTGEMTNGLISLDGIAGRYPNWWLYYYLVNLSSVKPNSTQSSYARLENRPLDSTIFYQIIPGRVGQIPANKASSLWRDLKVQSDSVHRNLGPGLQYTGARTEMIALIAYLQSIPPTRERTIADSVRRAEYVESEKQWKATYLDSNSILITTALSKNDQTIRNGGVVYSNYCTPCHGDSARGNVGPNLTDEYWLHGGSVYEMATTISFGIPERGMKTWWRDLKPVEIGEVIAYIKSLEGTEPGNQKAPQGKKAE